MHSHRYNRQRKIRICKSICSPSPSPFFLFFYFLFFFQNVHVIIRRDPAARSGGDGEGGRSLRVHGFADRRSGRLAAQHTRREGAGRLAGGKVARLPEWHDLAFYL